MAEDQRPGAAAWIDHFVVPTIDLGRWKRFAEQALGGIDPNPDAEPDRLAFMLMGRHHNGGSPRSEPLPDPPPDGAAPRYGFYTRPEDLDAHRQRLERLGIETTDPAVTSSGGEEGIGVSFHDPDGNLYELWAPRSLPPGAMEGGNPVGIGRICHVVFGARDLQRSLDFHTRYLGVDPIHSSDIPRDAVVLRLAGGPRLIFQQVDADAPTRDQEWAGGHVAFAVRYEEWDLVHERLWAGLPEASLEALEAHREPGGQPHPAWTRQRASMLRRGMAAPRGYGFTDWDGHAFHYVRGKFAPGDSAFYEVVPTVGVE